MTAPTGDRRQLLVTGGGRGIGAAIVRALAGSGQEVILTYRSAGVTLPRIQACMSSAVIRRIYVAEGQALKVRSKLFDAELDLSAAAPHDCPPISNYRFTLRERV